MTYSRIEAAIKDLTECAKPPPFTVFQPATRDVAKQIFKTLNKEGIYPEREMVYALLIENKWREKDAEDVLKKMKKHFAPKRD